MKHILFFTTFSTQSSIPFSSPSLTTATQLVCICIPAFPVSLYVIQERFPVTILNYNHQVYNSMTALLVIVILFFFYLDDDGGESQPEIFFPKILLFTSARRSLQISIRNMKTHSGMVTRNIFSVGPVVHVCVCV